MGSPNCRDGNHPDTMNKAFRALLGIAQDATHYVAINYCTQKSIKHEKCNKREVFDEQLHWMELCIYYSINVQVGGLDGKPVSHMCRCPGGQIWCGGNWRNDLVWVMQHSVRGYGAQNGRLPWQLQRLCEIRLLKEYRAFVEYCLALALTTRPQNSGNLNLISKFVPVRRAPAAVALQVFTMGIIVGCKHRIPVIASSRKTGDGRNEWWIVNSHIDLVTWNAWNN